MGLLMTEIVKENMMAADEDRLPDDELLAQMKCVPPNFVPAPLLK